MKILLDTNFIIACVRQKIDFENLANEIFDEKIEWIVPQEILNELGYLKDRRGMKTRDREAAAFAFAVLQNLKPEPTVVELGVEKNIDMGIINYILGKSIILATLDKELKNRVENRILTIRGKKSLEII